MLPSRTNILWGYYMYGQEQEQTRTLLHLNTVVPRFKKNLHHSQSVLLIGVHTVVLHRICICYQWLRIICHIKRCILTNSCLIKVFHNSS